MFTFKKKDGNIVILSFVNFITKINKNIIIFCLIKKFSKYSQN